MAAGLSDVSLELIAPSWEVGSQLVVQMYQRIMDCLGIPVEWVLCVDLSIQK